jgi:outer membrane protein assembly factor BamB
MKLSRLNRTRELSSAVYGLGLVLGQLLLTHGQTRSDDAERALLAPELRALGHYDNGSFQLEASVPKGRHYALQASADLQEWRRLSSLVGTDEDLSLTDASGVSSDRQFYRLVPDSGMFHCNPTHTGVADSTGLLGTNITVKWKFRTGAAVLSSPTVVAGVVYIGSLDTNLYAIDAESGVEKWHYTTGGPIRSTPAVADGVVYTYSRDGLVYSLTAGEAHQLWATRIAETNQTRSFDDYEYFDSSPTVVDDVLYIGSGDRKLYAIDVKTGQAIWTYSVGSKISSPPAVAHGVVYFGVTDGNFYALNAATGTNLWQFKTQGNPNNGYPKGDVLHAPVVVAGVVYFGSRDSAVYALDAATGKRLWRCPIMGGNNWAADSPAVWNSLLLEGSSITGALTAIDTATGKQKWVCNTYNQLALYSSPVVVGAVAYFGTGEVRTNLSAPALPKVAPGYVQAVDLRTGKDKWRIKLDGHVWSSPSMVKGVLYVGCLDGAVYALMGQ